MPHGAKLPHVVGFYKRNQYRYSKEDGESFILSRRKLVKKGQSLYYLMSVTPSGSSFYWSGLYPIGGSENLYRAEYKHIWYLVLFSDEGMSIALRTATDELPGMPLDSPPNKVPLNINRNFVTHRVTNQDSSHE